MNLKNHLGRIIDKAGRLLCQAGRKLNPPIQEPACRTPQEQIFDKWFADEGDKTSRLDYDLSEDSLVLDVGGYEGQWASDIFLRYRCFIHIFEPVPAFAANIARRILRNKRIVLHPCGLGRETKLETISVCDNGSSIFKKASQSVEIPIMSAAEFLRRERITLVDLIKINIEGGEYDLLEHLIETGFVTNIRNIQVQFHDFVPQAEARMLAIQAALTKTHELTWQYRFVWENWRLRDGNSDAINPKSAPPI